MKITRRTFLKESTAASTALLLAGSAHAEQTAWPGPIGLEQYTVRRQYERDPLATLKQVAAIGYKEFEMGGTDIPPDTFNSYMQQTGLKAPSGHFDYPSDADKYAKQIDYAKKIGLTYMVCSFTDQTDESGWKRVAETLNRGGKQCKDAGLQFAYHNHMTEFIQAGNTNGYEIILANTDPQLVKLQMDVFWMTYAKQDPLHWFRRAPGRFPMLHIKDMKKNIQWDSRHFPKEGSNPFTEVGNGRINWRRVFAHVKEAGAEHIYVEQDECDRPPIESARISFEYLKHLQV